ncbi:hypothetical protein MANES_06G158400v8 [Manihot esculenta]|uniref:Angiotensin-converting enzyme 2 n=1 Tax=Manihot esculenta TaxID=3983 RepID=A0A2C9VRA5_MANES|nr:hypothetical protein MANES_06G158400v8 [Manihot esculenta]
MHGTEMKVLQDSKDLDQINFSTQTAYELPNDQQNNASEALGVDSDSVSVSGNNSRKVTREDIEVVQNLIERCLQLYMNRNEVVNTLLQQARIEPGFTALVWQKLEEENADFFKAYYMRLILQKQIIVFNQLLEHQYHLMKSSTPPKVPLAPIENGIRQLPVNNLPMVYNIPQQPPFPSTGPPQLGSVGSVPSCHLANGIPTSGNFHPMQINAGKETVMNISPAGPIPAVPAIKSEIASTLTSVTSNGQFPFTPTEISELSVNASALDSAYASHMTSPEGLQLGLDSGTDNSRELQPFCQVPWTLSFSDLTADLANVEDHGQLGNYSGSDILLDSPEQNDIVEEFFLDNVPAPGNQKEE